MKTVRISKATWNGLKTEGDRTSYLAGAGMDRHDTYTWEMDGDAVVVTFGRNVRTAHQPAAMPMFSAMRNKEAVEKTVLETCGVNLDTNKMTRAAMNAEAARIWRQHHGG